MCKCKRLATLIPRWTFNDLNLYHLAEFIQINMFYIINLAQKTVFWEITPVPKHISPKINGIIADTDDNPDYFRMLIKTKVQYAVNIYFHPEGQYY